jgi:hypothetical protein
VSWNSAASEDNTWRGEDYQRFRRVSTYPACLPDAAKIFVASMLINGYIEAIIQRGEERTAELNSKYDGLNLEDLSNFKIDSSLQQWEGEDFRGGCKSLNLNMLSLSVLAEHKTA